jgi:hypothetical protein
MGFDVFVERFQNGEPAVVTDPRVWDLLREAWEAPPDHHDYSRVRRGAGEADLYAVQVGEPIDSLMFSRQAGGAEIFDLIVDVARAGDMVIYAPGFPPCVVSEEQRSQLPEELTDSMGQPTVVANGAELLAIIEET